MNLLNDLRAQWNMIGIALDVDSGTLDCLKTSSQLDAVKLDEVITAWIKTAKPSVTWKTLIDAIKGPLIRNNKKANEICDYLGIPH